MPKSRPFAVVVFLGAIAAAHCGGAPSTGPDKTPAPSLAIACDAPTDSTLKCRASVSCGASPCAGTPTDVTASATWSVDSSVVQLVAPGSIVAPLTFLTASYTNLRAQVPQMESGCQGVGVFPGVTAPLPTFNLVGRVYAGSDPVAGAINGATIEVIGGLSAGFIAQTGITFPSSGWCTPPPAPASGTFFLRGIPPGTNRLLIQAGGYQSLERDVTFTFSGPPATVDFQLQRQ